MRPIIGITASIDSGRHYLNRVYVDAIARAGATPLVLPANECMVVPLESRLKASREIDMLHVVSRRSLKPSLKRNDNIAQALDIIDGLLLSGGGDISADFFGQETHKMSSDIWPERDKAEIAAARLAFSRNLPILGICRGLQILNVALGGDIKQHIEEHKQSQPRNVPTHGVETCGPLAEIMGKTQVMVNSIHHQAADRVADGLTVCATAPDGIVEALCAPRKPFVLAVQWHPEELIHMPEHFRIFEAFVAACC